MTAIAVADWLDEIGIVPPAKPCPPSELRFEDGSRYRYEIASVEGPGVFRAVLEEADSLGLRIDRVSQGSGVMLLSDAEIREMVALGHEHDVEVCLFLGPRGAWDAGGQAAATDAAASVARGAEAVHACVAEARRACGLGIRSLLVADIGVLDVIARLRAIGRLPAELRLKSSASLCAANPATAAVLERLGANTINVATDLEVGMFAAARTATSLPLDVYIESPDDLGGFVRSYSAPDIVEVAAPVYLKFGLRNATSVYPSGGHLESVATSQAREKVRRAWLTERLLRELTPDLARTA
jgi:hypothetical protein